MNKADVIRQNERMTTLRHNKKNHTNTVTQLNKWISASKQQNPTGDHTRKSEQVNKKRTRKEEKSTGQESTQPASADDEEALMAIDNAPVMDRCVG